MKLTECKNEYKTLKITDFYTTEKFEYEVALDIPVNKYFRNHPLTLDYKSNLVKWVKCKWNGLESYLNFIDKERGFKERLTQDCNENRVRKLIHDSSFYKSKEKDKWIDKLYHLDSLLPIIPASSNIFSNFQREIYSFIYHKCYSKAFINLKSKFNGYSDEFLEWYLNYLIHNQKKKIQIFKGIVFKGPFKLESVKKCKKSKEMRKYQTPVIRQRRSAEKIERKKKQVYDNYKKLRKKQRKTKSQLFHKDYYSEEPRAIQIKSYAIHTKNGLVIPIWKERSNNYQHILKKHKISIKDVKFIYRTNVESWGNNTKLVFKNKKLGGTAYEEIIEKIKEKTNSKES